jgi:hypothetical protein
LRLLVDKLSAELASRRSALSEQELAAEAGLLAGKPIDERPLVKAQEEVRLLESRLERHARAAVEASRRVEVLEKEGAIRTEALLKPIFETLIATLSQQVQAAAATERLLERAHHVAVAALLGVTNSPLVQGYGGAFAPAVTVQ